MTVLHFIDGSETASRSGRTFPTVNPADGTALEEVAYGGRDDVAAAVDSAAACFDRGDWRHLRPSERARRLRRVADAIRDQARELARLECADSGKPLTAAEADILSAADLADFASTLCEHDRGATYPQGPGCFVHSRREPYGIVGAIAPWNFPFLLAVWKTAPALAVGNSVVLKMAEQTPLTTAAYARLCAEAGLPAGALNVVHGDGATGEALVDDPRVEKITFTGSTQVGRRILERSARHVRSVHLELGGKTPNIVLADADIEQAIAGSLFTAFFNSGQICTAGTRLLVDETIADEFLQRLQARAEALVVGDPMDPGTQVGPLVSAEQRDRVERYIALGREAGASLLVGGGRQDGAGMEGGFYVTPTIFGDVTSDMQIAREEIFGPVLSVLRFSDLEDAIRIANDTQYGLAATVWTTRLDHAMTMVDRLDAGILWVNCPHRLDWNVPYEGHKVSGSGEDLGVEAAAEFTKLKVSYMQYDGSVLQW